MCFTLTHIELDEVVLFLAQKQRSAIITGIMCDYTVYDLKGSSHYFKMSGLDFIWVDR